MKLLLGFGYKNYIFSSQFLSGSPPVQMEQVFVPRTHEHVKK